MDRTEALEILGVDETTDRKSIRRAYLRLVKKHKPDQDPEGFQRVREAYETASQLSFDLWTQFTASSVDIERPAPTPAHESPNQPSSSPAETTPENRETQTPEPQPIQVVLDEEDLFALRVLGSPGDLDDDELARLLSSGDPVLILRAANLRTAGGTDDAHLEELVAAGLAAVGPVDPVPLEASLRLVPRLVERQQLDLANRLLQAARESLGLQGGRAALNSETILFYYLLEEFVQLPEDFPESARKIILRGLATGDLIAADDELMEWAGKNPYAARAGAAQLQGLPELGRYFGVSLDVPDSSATASFDPFRMVSIVMMILAINVLPRACNQSRSYSTTPPAPKITAGSYQSDLGAACGTKLPVGTPVDLPCAKAYQVIQILTERDCSSILPDTGDSYLLDLERLTGEISEDGWSATRQKLERLTADRLRPAWQRLETTCLFARANMTEETRPNDE